MVLLIRENEQWAERETPTENGGLGSQCNWSNKNDLQRDEF